MDRPIPEESPVASMCNDECKELVDHWNNPQTMVSFFSTTNSLPCTCLCLRLLILPFEQKICAKNKKKETWNGPVSSSNWAAQLCSASKIFGKKKPVCNSTEYYDRCFKFLAYFLWFPLNAFLDNSTLITFIVLLCILQFYARVWY
jgi:hypothetical protein